jgi:hypothetical protein
MESKLNSDELRSLEFPRIPSASRPEYFTIYYGFAYANFRIYYGFAYANFRYNFIFALYNKLIFIIKNSKICGGEAVVNSSYSFRCASGVLHSS